MSSNSSKSDASQGVIYWVDANVNRPEHSSEVDRLREVFADVRTFEASRPMEIHRKKQLNPKPTFVITSGSLAKDSIEKSIGYPEVQRIYVYCQDVGAHEKWKQEYPIVERVTKNLEEIIEHMRLHPFKTLSASVPSQEAMMKNPQRRKEEPFSYSISDPFICAIDDNFLHWQIIIEILPQLKPQQDPKTEFIEYITKENIVDQNDAEFLQRFKAEYRPEKSIQWYIRDCFLHRIFNKALRELNGITLYIMRFFICDVKEQLRDISKQEKASMVKVYRAQRMTQDEIEIFNRSKDKWISINTFMLASKDQQKALDVVMPSDNTETVLFEIDAFADSMKHQPYAAVGQESDSRNQDEILFVFGSIFRIKTIGISRDPFKKIYLEQCSENEAPLKTFYENLDKEIGRNPIDAFFYGDILRQMSRFDDAEYFVENYHKGKPDDQRYHIHIGRLLFDQKKYEKSLEEYQTALNYFTKTQMKQEMADTHFEIGLLHQKQNNHEAARKFFDEAMTLYKKLHGGEDRTVARCHDEIGNSYENEKNFPDALHSRISALEIWKKKLGKMDAELGHVYVSLGVIDVSLVDYETALNNFDKARCIYSDSLPPNHPRIAFLYKNEGVARENLKEIDKAKDAYQKALEMYKKCSPKNEAEIEELNARLKNLSKLKLGISEIKSS